MIWTSLVESLIRNTVDDAVAKAAQARKAECVRRLDFYNDNQAPYIQEELAKHFAKPDLLTPVFINITKKIVNLLSMTYLQPPKRALSGTVDVGALEAIWDGAALDITMKEANRLAKLLGTVLIRVAWRKGKIALDVLTGDVLDVTVGDSPSDLESVMVTVWPESGKKEEVTFSLWTPEEFRKLDYRGDTISTEVNPYGVIPFVACHDRNPTTDFWVEGHDDLIAAQVAINERLTDLCYILRLQGFGVPVLKGMEETSRSMTLGPGAILTLPKDKDADFYYAKSEAPIEETIKAIEFLIKQCAISNGLPASSLTSDVTDQSGVSLIVSNRELEELRRDDIELWRGYEQKLFQVMKQVWNVHASKKIPESATLQIDFADPKPSITPEAQARTWDALLQLGIINEIDILLEKNPDLESRENALAHLLQMQEESRILNERKV